MVSNSDELIRGIQVIRHHVDTMPTAAGVYRMLDAQGKVLYVGKAKNLVKRVSSYTHPERLPYRIQAMIAQTVAMEVVTTATEAEALLLEANFIKTYEPKYNILLKDDKSYPYILITKDHDFPKILKHRGEQKQVGTYYGPFASAGAVNQAIADIQKAFLLRPCTDSYFAARTRPCMEYQIKRCSAPCVGKVDKAEYAYQVQQARDFLSGKTRQVQDQLSAAMQDASTHMDYEKAAVIRDRIKALNHIQAKQSVRVAGLGDADVMGLYQDKGECCIQVFFFRGGQNFGNKSYFPSHTQDMTAEDVLTAFLAQFYQGNPPPPEVVIPVAIPDKDALEEALGSLVTHKVRLIVPQKGDKKALLAEVERNAKFALQQRAAGKMKQQKLLEGVAELFKLSEIPKRIEIFDNSHIMGKHDVGAMVVAGPEGFVKKAYRRFNIKSSAANTGDDYGMLAEVLTRRYSRLKQEVPERMPGIWPDLILIDGGAGHLSTAIRVFEQLGLLGDIVFACISKGPDRNAGREQFHVPGQKAFTLEMGDPVLHYLQVLRDEAHHFAIGSHRKKRKKSATQSVLDAIPGIGAKRKKQLLQHFGSADGVKSASIQDLCKVEGINQQVAQKIYDYFKH